MMIFDPEQITPVIVPDAKQQSGSVSCDWQDYQTTLDTRAGSLTFEKRIGWKNPSGVFVPVKTTYTRTVGGGIYQSIKTQLAALTSNPLSATPDEFITLINGAIAASVADLKAKQAKAKP